MENEEILQNKDGDDSLLLERLIKKVDREVNNKIHNTEKDNELKELKTKEVFDWLKKSTKTLTENIYLEPSFSKDVVTIHVGVFKSQGKGKLTQTYNIRTKMVNNTDEYMIEKISFDWRGQGSMYHREIENFKELREYLLKDLSKEIAFTRKHDELVVHDFPDEQKT